jgi:hypothetical protein
MSSSPPAIPPDGGSAVAGSTTTTFKLPAKRSAALLANSGLAQLYQIFGVRATMQPSKDAADVVDIMLTGSNYYAALACRWIMSRVAPDCQQNFQLSSAQVSRRCPSSSAPPLLPLPFILRVCILIPVTVVSSSIRFKAARSRCTSASQLLLRDRTSCGQRQPSPSRWPPQRLGGRSMDHTSCVHKTCERELGSKRIIPALQRGACHSVPNARLAAAAVACFAR